VAAAIALIAAEPAQAEHAGRFGAIERRLGASFWPGPLTIVVPAAETMSQLLAPRGTLGVRVPDHPVARELARRFGECITATSANPSGTAAPASAAGVVRAFSEGIDLLLDAGGSRGGAPSTIVEVVDGRLILHRAGAIAWERVLESVQ
jgi:L-threonylcarbamoyladenylate synthase